ncbi:hypothetical protein SPRG_21670 [Saprolegnia parasitica CBS 223.65]|uniref:Uncharacterized protein n=1 Tax=Saprolegnia parasitica (strain CBS 223.65) TaxID=695850 RepID=A0A067BJK8_SAPPC|nr:hypothetical protein SPRG_21670 [Saprolegnia parasitica CBS 223.65]KDO18619.1 hypothetical protein SPRG_21670 [Saprolegnia parasitica CBS 223.65]|eukprot:XP_012210665.1 hypothetical protein SPRG_21670 [Saprolegnia parasitica CBS 223.65]
MTETSLPAWVATNPHVVAWDDGFRPSGAAATDAAPAPGKMVVDQPKSSPGLFRVVENAVPDAVAAALYESAVAAKVWGVYIRTSDIFDRSLEAYPATKDDHARHTLALCTIRAFLLNAEASIPAADWANTHGVVVWVITSTVSDTVAYHMDYAEMFRYQTNVTYPPIYGATLHVSRLNETPESHMEGGAFYANTRGLDHYKEHGYKESLAPLPSVAEMTTDASYVVVPYKYKRGIVMDGNFPHGSIPVTALPSETARVVVGFNLFNFEIGPHAEAYPEHSAKFNKYVKVAQAAAAKTATLSLASIKRCPRQAAFLRFLLRKAKEKNLIQNATFVGHTSSSTAT